MKKLLVFVASIIAQNCLYSQSIEEQFKSLQLNSSPGYVILGVDPENIQRPNSPTDFVANAQSAIVNGKLQPNFAMATSPYFWNKPKDAATKFDATEYLRSQKFGKNLLKSITFSFATSQSDSFTFGSIPVGTGVGFGFHVQLLQGHISENVEKNLQMWFDATRAQSLLEGLVAKLEAQNNNTIDDLDTWLKTRIGYQSYDGISDENKASIITWIKSKINRNSLSPADLADVRKLRDQVKDNSQTAICDVNKYCFPLTREGFMLELAFANAGIAEQNVWNRFSQAKAAFWLTPSYRFNINEDPEVIDIIDAMAVVRMTFNSKLVDSTNYFDGGLKLQWIHNRISFAVEGILRYLTEKPETQTKGYTFKTDISFGYKINDFVTFKTSVGSNFDGNSIHYDDPKKIFIVGGLNFGFSNFLKN